MSPIPPELPAIGVGAGLAWRVLGPPLDRVAHHLSGFVDYAADNIGAVFQAASDKLPAELEDGAVNVRAAVKIIDEAAFAETDVVVDYLGGVMASSRLDAGDGDQGVSWSALIGRLSSNQLRLHYLLYSGLREIAQREDLMLDTRMHEVYLFAPFSSLFEAAPELESADPSDVFGEAFLGLKRELLLGDQFGWGNPDYLAPVSPDVPESGVIFTPTFEGVRLFMWGHGRGGADEVAFSSDAELPSTLDLPSANVVRIRTT